MTISVPTIDQITGNTVMVKMRSLIKSYIAFATEISENVPTREDIGDFVRPFLSEYYTKEEVDEMLENIDLTDYYKKSQVDALLNDKANAATTYTKSQVDALISPKADASNVYTKSQTDALISPKADANNVYTKSETNALISPKADANNVYTKSQTDALISPKADASNVYTKTETDNLLENKQDELTAGSGISILNNVISSSGFQMIDLEIEVSSTQSTDATLNNIQDGDILIIYYTTGAYSDVYFVYIGGSSTKPWLSTPTVYNSDVFNMEVQYYTGLNTRQLRLRKHAVGSLTNEYVALTGIRAPHGKIIRSL